MINGSPIIESTHVAPAQPHLKGIAGWLALVAVGLCWSALATLVELFSATQAVEQALDVVVLVYLGITLRAFFGQKKYSRGCSSGDRLFRPDSYFWPCLPIQAAQAISSGLLPEASSGFLTFSSHGASRRPSQIDG